VEDNKSIFISYRRDDTPSDAGWLADDLGDHFGEQNVFRDIGSIEPGMDFVEALERALEACAVMLVVIGRDWATKLVEHRRTGQEDFTRLEVTTALKRNVRVIPVLVRGASMPPAKELPDDLAALARRQAIELHDTSWKRDVRDLMAVLEKVVEVGQTQGYEREREEREQLEEKQSEMNKLRAEVLRELQARASDVAKDVRSWAENATSLDPETLPPTGFMHDTKANRRRQLTAFQTYAEAVQKRDSVVQQMESLRSYYQGQRPSLSISQREVFESFSKEFDRQVTPLSAKLPHYESIRQRFDLIEDLSSVNRLLWFGMEQDSPISNDAAIKAWEKEWVGIPEAARNARDWDFGSHNVAFEKEIERLTGTTS
jgi:TIR domain